MKCFLEPYEPVQEKTSVMAAPVHYMLEYRGENLVLTNRGYIVLNFGKENARIDAENSTVHSVWP